MGLHQDDTETRPRNSDGCPSPESSVVGSAGHNLSIRTNANGKTFGDGSRSRCNSPQEQCGRGKAATRGWPVAEGCAGAWHAIVTASRMRLPAGPRKRLSEALFRSVTAPQLRLREGTSGHSVPSSKLESSKLIQGTLNFLTLNLELNVRTEQ